MRQLAFLKNTLLTPPPKNIQTKGPKKSRSTSNEALTSRILSMWERDNSQFLDSLTSQKEPIILKKEKCSYWQSIVFSSSNAYFGP